MLQSGCQHVVCVVGVTLLMVSSLMHCRHEVVALSLGVTSLDAVTTCFCVEVSALSVSSVAKQLQCWKCIMHYSVQ